VNSLSYGATSRENFEKKKMMKRSGRVEGDFLYNFNSDRQKSGK